MALTRMLLAAVLMVGLLIAAPIPVYSQLRGGPQDAASILNSMPADVLAKVQALAQILQQGIKEGKLTDADIRQGLLSGRLAEKLKQLDPEADRLLQDISRGIKDGTGPGQESVLPLLQGLGGQLN